MIVGEDLIAVAEKYAAGECEADWRSAVSRAYDGAFHAARDFLVMLGFDPPKAEHAHAYLWRRLSSSEIGSLASTGVRLNQLRGERNRADYDLFRTVRRMDAVAATDSARRISNELRGLTKDEQLRVTEAIRRYETDVLLEPTWRRLPR